MSKFRSVVLLSFLCFSGHAMFSSESDSVDPLAFFSDPPFSNLFWLDAPQSSIQNERLTAEIREELKKFHDECFVLSKYKLKIIDYSFQEHKKLINSLNSGQLDTPALEEMRSKINNLKKEREEHLARRSEHLEKNRLLYRAYYDKKDPAMGLKIELCMLLTENVFLPNLQYKNFFKDINKLIEKLNCGPLPERTIRNIEDKISDLREIADNKFLANYNKVGLENPRYTGWDDREARRAHLAKFNNRCCLFGKLFEAFNHDRNVFRIYNDPSEEIFEFIME